MHHQIRTYRLTVHRAMWTSNVLIPIYSFDGDVFHNHTYAINGHTYTTLANINGFPLAVGGYNETSHTNKAEIFDISANDWIEKADYPYHKL